MSKNITAWERVKMCNETKHQYLSKRTDHCLSDTPEIWLTSLCQQLCLDIGPDRMSQSFSGHKFCFVFFSQEDRPLPDTSLPPPSMKGLRQKAVSYQKSNSLKPAEGFLQQGTITPPPAPTAFLSLFSLQVYSQALSPKHRGTKAQQLTEIKSDISTICLKMWGHWLISFI